MDLSFFENLALLSIIVFLAISAFLGFIILLIADMTRQRRETLRQRQGLVDLPLRRAMPDTGGAPGQLYRPGIIGWFQSLVMEAGSEITPQEGFLLTLMAGTLTGGLAFLWQQAFGATLIGFFVGSMMLMVIFLICRSRRRKAVLAQLPEVTEFLSRSVMAGESLDQALAAAGATIPAPLGPEMKNCARQLHMGLSLNATLHGFLRRAPMLETRMFCSSLLVQRHAGGDLGALLKQMAAVFRDRLSYNRQFRAATIASRLSAFLIAGLSITIAVYTLVFSPHTFDESSMVQTTQYILAAGIGLEIIGLTAVFFILKNNY